MARTVMIFIRCPNLVCRCILGVPAYARGRIVRCRTCGKRIKVPPSRNPATAVTEGGPITGPVHRRVEHIDP